MVLLKLRCLLFKQCQICFLLCIQCKHQFGCEILCLQLLYQMLAEKLNDGFRSLPPFADQCCLYAFSGMQTQPQYKNNQEKYGEFSL